MTQKENINDMTDAEREAKASAWNQNEYVKIQKYCISQGIQPKRIIQNKCQVLAPIFGIWYVESTVKGEDFWILSGDLPSDIAPVNVAKNARDALRYFSMKWQLNAANLAAELAEGKTQVLDKGTREKYIQELITKSEVIYTIYNDENIWKGTGFILD